MRRGEGPAVTALILECFWRFNAAQYGDQPHRFTDTVDPEELARMEAEDLVLVAEDAEGRLVGVAALVGGSHLELMFVDGDFHGQGLGRALWQALLAHEDPPPDAVTVKSSDHAVGFYARLGFVAMPSERPEVRPTAWSRPRR